MLLAWLLLGIGNIIGAWWAYVELGWGGYWAWDLVENAGLMPWLMATALLHSSIIQRRKGLFRVWNMVLAILTFCLVLFGTFLTRSGILSSVHTFNDSGLTPYFVVFIAVALFGSLLLLYSRYEDFKGESGTEPVVSRETTFLICNTLFIGITVAVLLGTVFPAISEAFLGAKLSLSAAFFNRVNSPLFMAIILLAGICTLVGWKQESFSGLFKKIQLPLAVAAALTIIVLAIRIREPLPLIALFTCSFVLVAILKEWFKDVKAHHHQSSKSHIAAFWQILFSNNQRYGGYIVHIAVILIAVGIIGSSFYGIEKEYTLKTGESMTINQYTVTYNGMDSRSTPDDEIVSARLSVYSSGALIGNLEPQKLFHKAQAQPVSEVAIRSSLWEDLYIILESWQDNGAAADFKILVNPMVSWIWFGGVIFLLGGLVAFLPGRRGKIGEMAVSYDSKPVLSHIEALAGMEK